MKRRNFIYGTAGLSFLAALTQSEGLRASLKRSVQHTNNNNQQHDDAIVVGVGSMGASACYYLAKGGVKVLGIDQFDIPNEMSSHTGQTRIIRKAYFEHPDYVPLLERSYLNWKALEDATGSQIYYKTGLLYFAKPDHALMRGVHESADRFGIQINTLSSNEVEQKFPQFRLPSNYEKLLEPEAGFLTPERAILQYIDQAIKSGAVVKTNSKVMQWYITNDGVKVVTSSQTYYAKKLIITAGPWAGKLIPKLASELTVTKQVLGWVIPNKSSQFELGNLPCWTIVDESKSGNFYGFPILPTDKFDGPLGYKIAHHYKGPKVNPDRINRSASDADKDELKHIINKFFPDGYKDLYTTKTCMYTNTPDDNFIIDMLPGYDQKVVIAAGFSGHGFKFTSVVGEIIRDLILEEKTSLPINFFRLERLQKHK